MKTMKKAQAGASMPKKPVAKPAVKKSMAPTPKKKTYPILSDDGENYNGPKAGPREMNPKGMSKNGSMMKKAKVGGEFGMLSVKAGVDNNPNPTAADRIAGATKGKAKSGAKMKKAMMGMHKMPDGSMMKNSMMKMGGAMAKQAAVAIAMKKAGKTPNKKMQYGGNAASMTPPAMMKKGGMMKKCKYGCK